MPGSRKQPGHTGLLASEPVDFRAAGRHVAYDGGALVLALLNFSRQSNLPPV